MNPALTVTIIVAAITVGGSIALGLLNRRVSTQDLWKENREQRKEMDEREKFYEDRDNARQKVIGILVTALDIVLHYISPTVTFSDPERNVIDEARKIQSPILKKEDSHG